MCTWTIAELIFKFSTRKEKNSRSKLIIDLVIYYKNFTKKKKTQHTYTHPHTPSHTRTDKKRIRRHREWGRRRNSIWPIMQMSATLITSSFASPDYLCPFKPLSLTFPDLLSFPPFFPVSVNIPFLVTKMWRNLLACPVEDWDRLKKWKKKWLRSVRSVKVGEKSWEGLQISALHIGMMNWWIPIIVSGKESGQKGTSDWANGGGVVL